MGDEEAGDAARRAAGAPARGELPQRQPGWQDADAPEPVTLGSLVSGAAGLIGTLASGLIDDDDDLVPPGPRNKGPDVVVPPDLHQTAAPAFDDDGLIACTRCQRRVPFASMALNEHGYFCATCGPSKPADPNDLRARLRRKASALYVSVKSRFEK